MTSTAVKLKSEFSDVQWILLEPGDSIGTYAGFWWCILREMVDKVVHAKTNTTGQRRVVQQKKIV